MDKYKKILIGTNVFSPDWLTSIKKINKPNIFLCNFENNLEKVIDENKIINKPYNYAERRLCSN